MHLKRSKAPRTWPIPRKGKKYLVVPSHNKKQGIPLLIMLREILEIAKTRKEAKKILSDKKIKVNNKVVREEKYPLCLFDKLEIGNRIYQIIIDKNRKFKAEEVKSLESKTSKIIGKKILSKGKIQVNLNDGRNFISKEKVSMGDSVVINLANKKIEKIIPLKTGAKVFIIGGKHLGEQGKIEKIDENKKLALVLPHKINVKLNNLMAI